MQVEVQKEKQLKYGRRMWTSCWTIHLALSEGDATVIVSKETLEEDTMTRRYYDQMIKDVLEFAKR